MKYFLALLVIVIAPQLHAQIPTQTVRGIVLDNQSKSLIFGAIVVLVDSNSKNGSASNEQGAFKLNAVTIGRHKIRVSFLGYTPRIIPVDVTSGKEVVLTIELEENVIQGAEVVIEAYKDKTKANNDMSTNSTRSFTIEETSKYAGSRNDPARMVANYAGVSGSNDSRNDIIIRGNSPSGVLWRLNGMDIPNPNHFGSLGSTGGPVGILNNNVLDNSDFMTGAFAAEYGNATAGVFDLKMRSGNNEQHEFMGQIGFNGLEAGAEGPISKKTKASYLVNYRYSTLKVFQALGIDFGTGSSSPQYQDVSFKLDFPTKKIGKFNVFGLGGKSFVALLDSKRDTTKKNFYEFGKSDIYFGSDMGFVGASHFYAVNSKAYNKLNIGLSGAQTTIQSYDVNKQLQVGRINYGNRSLVYKFSLNDLFVYKLNARNTIKSGFFIDQINFLLKDSTYDDSIYRRLRNSIGNTYLVQMFSQWQHKFSDQLTLNTGLHYQQLLLNQSKSLEPRIGLKWQFKPKQSLSLAAGMHSQMQSIYAYFSETRLPNNTYINTNTNLDFTRSNHLVLAYDINITDNMRIKTEAYYQQLNGVPVEIRKSGFSMANEGADFNNPSIDSLVNKGSGNNLGFEFTLEKFLSKGYYYLLTTSLFDSKYKGSDGIERNTGFNGNYIINALAGKEIIIGNRMRLNLGVKSTFAGGKRYTPINLNKSIAAGEEVRNTLQPYSEQLNPYFRTDIKIGFKIEGKHITQEFSIDIQNITNQKNVFTRSYSPSKQAIATEYQLGLFIIPQFRITF
jgi:CarboxypepD_reg-like domain/TonB-dependent Receptor Plug Domain